MLLAKLGNDMGLKVWVARNDRNRSCKGHTFTSLPNLLTELPVQFDDATRRTIELIDVLWLKSSAVVAAFEIESTTSIYSGLLRIQISSPCSRTWRCRFTSSLRTKGEIR